MVHEGSGLAESSTGLWLQGFRASGCGYFGVEGVSFGNEGVVPGC